MTKIDLTKDLVPLSEFRANASPILKQLREEGGTIVVTHNGKAAAVMMDVKEYQEMLITMEELKSIVSNLLESVDKSKLIPGEEVLQRAKERREYLEKNREDSGGK